MNGDDVDDRERPPAWVHRLPTLFRSRRARWLTLVVLVVAALALVGLGLLSRRYLALLSDPVALRALVASYGPAAPLAFVGVQALQVVLAPIPGQVLGLASGYLFGVWLGTLYSVVGATIGSVVAFGLARRFGRPFVEHVIHDEVLAAFDDLVQREGTLALFLVFLVPGLPDDAICLMGGLTTLSIPRLVAIAIVGRLPGFFLLNLAGAGVAEGDPVLAGAVVAFVAVAGVLVLWRREAVLAWLHRHGG